MKVDVYKLPQNSPDDLTALKAAIASGKINSQQIVAIMGKTEGNGCVNDFTRGFAVQTLQNYLANFVGQEQAAAIVYVMSGGTEAQPGGEAGRGLQRRRPRTEGNGCDHPCS